MKSPANGTRLNLKLNRSSRYTTGLVCTFADNDLRLFFFEVDMEHRAEFARICKFYDEHELDYVVHRTGGGGYHWLSPTMISKATWKRYHEVLKDINKECPMTTLRIEPNKHHSENVIWYNGHTQRFNTSPSQNNYQVCTLLNKLWHCNFLGSGAGDLKQVRYPLPLTARERWDAEVEGFGTS